MISDIEHVTRKEERKNIGRVMLGVYSVPVIFSVLALFTAWSNGVSLQVPALMFVLVFALTNLFLGIWLRGDLEPSMDALVFRVTISGADDARERRLFESVVERVKRHLEMNRYTFSCEAVGSTTVFLVSDPDSQLRITMGSSGVRVAIGPVTPDNERRLRRTLENLRVAIGPVTPDSERRLRRTLENLREARDQPRR